MHGGARIDWEALGQDVRFKAIRGLRSFRGQQEAAFVVWIGTMVDRVMLDVARRLKIEDRTGPWGSLDTNPQAISIPSAELTPLEAASLRERATNLREAMLRLPGHWREVTELRFYQGLPFGKIAGRMGLKGANAAKCLLDRALHKLRIELSPGEASQ